MIPSNRVRAYGFSLPVTTGWLHHEMFATSAPRWPGSAPSVVAAVALGATAMARKIIWCALMDHLSCGGSARCLELVRPGGVEVTRI